MEEGEGCCRAQEGLVAKRQRFTVLVSSLVASCIASLISQLTESIPSDQVAFCAFPYRLIGDNTHSQTLQTCDTALQ